MACSTHLLSQSLYPLHRSNPAAPRHLRFQARPTAASPVARSSSGPRSRRALGLRVAASVEQGRQVEVVYDPEAKFNQLADQVDKDAGITRLNLFSPCKINVFLRITGKRPDGFHDLASLFHVISLGDTIKFALSPSKSKDRLSTNVAGVPVDESNLIIKALNLYRKKTGTDNFFWIHLDKKVPTGAGLGGGSSNAATALWAANQFSGCIASEKDLQEWSGEIGSDIPFFFSRGAAYCTDRGEVIKLMQSFKSKEYVRETFSWQYYYWYLTNDGIEHLRNKEHTFKEQDQAAARRKAQDQAEDQAAARLGSRGSTAAQLVSGSATRRQGRRQPEGWREAGDSDGGAPHPSPSDRLRRRRRGSESKEAEAARIREQGARGEADQAHGGRPRAHVDGGSSAVARDGWRRSSGRTAHERDPAPGDEG